MKKLLIVLSFAALLIPETLSAAPYTGGEIRWDCLSNGRFRFTVVLYRECVWLNPGHNYVNLISNSPAGVIKLYPTDRQDITPICSPDSTLPHMDCSLAPPNMSNAGKGMVEKLTYTSDSLYPNGVMLQGVPPQGGWRFSADWCCRHPSTNLQNPSAENLVLRALMYPYQLQNTYPCFDNAPISTAPPQTAVCSGYPTSFYQYTDDPDGDHLTYEWAPPLDDINLTVLYASGYDYQYPLPGPLQHPDNTNRLDPYSGMVSLTSLTTGNFTNVIKVTSRRNGIKISEIFKELPMVVSDYNNQNTAPEVYIDGVLIPDTTNVIEYNVQVGDTLSLNILGLNDTSDLLANGDKELIQIEAFGTYFGENYTIDTTGCPLTPCATLSSAAPVSDSMVVGTVLTWPVSLDHFIALNTNPSEGSSYTHFGFRIADDYCPLPQAHNLDFRVNIRIDSLIETSADYCITRDSNQIVHIEWDTVKDHAGFFNSYKIYSTNSPHGTYTLLDSITNPGTCLYSASTMDHYFRLTASLQFPSGEKAEFKMFDAPIPKPIFPNLICTGDTFMIKLDTDREDGDSIWVKLSQGQVIYQNMDSIFVTFSTSGQVNCDIYLLDNCGQSVFNSIIDIQQTPIPTLTGPTYACPSVPVDLVAAPGATAYLWSNGSTQPNVFFPPNQAPFTIGLEVTAYNGCKAYREFYIRLVEPYEDEEICMTTIDNPLTNHPAFIWNKTQGKDTKGIYYSYSLDETPPYYWSTPQYLPFSSDPYQPIPVNGAQHGYTFRIQVMDSCDNNSDWSAPVSQLFLEIDPSANQNHLEWNQAFDTVYLHRSIDFGSYQFLATVLGDSNYTDHNPSGNVQHYQLEVPGFTCDTGQGGYISSLYSNSVANLNIGIDELNKVEDLSILADGKEGFRIIWDQSASGEYSMNIFDITGRRITQANITPIYPESKYRFDYPSGMYMVVIIRDGRMTASKFLIH